MIGKLFMNETYQYYMPVDFTSPNSQIRTTIDFYVVQQFKMFKGCQNGLNAGNLPPWLAGRSSW